MRWKDAMLLLASVVPARESIVNQIVVPSSLRQSDHVRNTYSRTPHSGASVVTALLLLLLLYTMFVLVDAPSITCTPLQHAGEVPDPRSESCS